jgi:hypothetical protein
MTLVLPNSILESAARRGKQSEQHPGIVKCQVRNRKFSRTMLLTSGFTQSRTEKKQTGGI